MIPIYLLLLIVCLPIAVLIWLAFRKGWLLPGSRFQQAGAFLPASAARPSRTARLVEAAVLGIAGILVLAAAATTRSTGGYILSLGDLPPEYATVNVIAFFCALAGVGVAILVAILGRTVAGTIVMAVVLIGYGTVLNGSHYPGQWFVPSEITEPDIEYLFDVNGTNVRDAELWINGVKVGTTPFTMTLSELEAKVPYWSKPPADIETARVKSASRYSLNGESYSEGKQWVHVELPFPHHSAIWSTWKKYQDRKQKTYYAKVRYGGEWAGQSGVGSSGGTNEFVPKQITVDFSVTFPKRQERLSKLLTMARLADYRVGPDWFEALETYQADGWIALYRAGEQDARMMEVLDAWATSRCKLDKAVDAESAWAAFQRICDDADTRGEYFTASATGRAVELLVPKLPPTRLVDAAVHWIRAYKSDYNLNCTTWAWPPRGRLQFGHTDRRGRVDLLNGTSRPFRWNSTSGWDYGKKPLSPRAFAVAHAVMLLNDQLSHSGTQSEPNILQRRIAPEIIRSQYKQYDWDLPMKTAIAIGGPDVDKFLLRQNWQAKPDQLDWSERNRFIGDGANKWLCYLACLDDDAGRRFRRKNADMVMDMADEMVRKDTHIFVYLPSPMEFIFLDPWLAKEYWPRFARQVRQRPSNHDSALQQQWQYLVCMGDAASPPMFVEAWENTKVEIGNIPLDLLDQLKPKMRQEVVNALARHIEEHPDQLQSVLKGWGTKENLLDMLYEHTSEQQLADRLFAKLRQGVPAIPEHVFRNMERWLAHTQPDSPLVAMLAKADKPELRRMAIGALREYPIPQYQKLLDKLLKDPDATVRTAAREASLQLKRLAARKPGEYASDPASPPNAPSTASVSGEKE